MYVCMYVYIYIYRCIYIYICIHTLHTYIPTYTRIYVYMYIYICIYIYINMCFAIGLRIYSDMHAPRYVEIPRAPGNPQRPARRKISLLTSKPPLGRNSTPSLVSPPTGMNPLSRGSFLIYTGRGWRGARVLLNRVWNPQMWMSLISARKD